jgi:DNA-binding beta-propeller fold protein YncE
MAIAALRKSIRDRSLLGLTAAGAASALMLGLTPAAAQAAVTETTVELPLVSAADVVASSANVFVSGGRTSSTVVVTSASGTNQRVVEDLPGPTDLELSADGSVLYVALPNANEIAAINTATLQETARFATGLGECPSSLAVIEQTLWFGYGCDQWGGNIGRINLAGAPATTVGLSSVDFHSHPLLSAGRTDPARLFAAQPSLSPSSVTVFAIAAGGTLEVAGQTEHTVVGSNLRDVDAAPDGATFYTASGAPYEIVQFESDQLTVARRRFVTGPYPNAVEVSHDGTQVAAAADGNGLFVFRPTSAQPTELSLTGSQSVADRGIAWAPSGAQLYAVTADFWGTTPATLHVYTASIAAKRLA